MRFPQYIEETNLARVHAHTQNRNIGMLTAHRGEYTKEENEERNKNLESDLRKHGFGFVHVKGRYIENHGTKNARPVDEHSYMVVGKKGDDKGHLLNTLKHLGKKYEQDSILHKPHNSQEAHLHGTREGGYPGLGKSTSVGNFHPHRAGEFHTVLKNKKTFSFESTDNETGDFVCESFKIVAGKSFFAREETELG